MLEKENRLLRVGVLGAGPISQFAHFESLQKGRNVELYALCDGADDLLDRMSMIWQPKVKYSNYDEMIADPNVEAVIIATSDAFHLPAALKAVEAGKHVFVEKPIGTSLAACEELNQKAKQHNVVVQVGHMKRFDPGILSAHNFIKEEMGEMMLMKAWYNDNTHRYTTVGNVQPKAVLSSKAIKPKVDEKADKQRYYLLTHGSHLFDTAYFLGGPIGRLRAEFRQKFGAYCWGIETEFKSGAIGFLDLIIPGRGDWKEGFSVSGENGSIEGKTFNPWFFKSSDVQIYHEKDATYTQVLGADAHFYRVQLESFADVILKGMPQIGTNIEEGIETVKIMLAIQQSVKSGKDIYLDTITEGDL